MRWIWTLAVACIIAATGVRPEQELRAEHAGQIDRAPASALQHLTVRVTGAQPVARHTPVAIVPATPDVSPPERSRAAASTWSLHVSHSQLVPAPSARGPPIG